MVRAGPFQRQPCSNPIWFKKTTPPTHPSTFPRSTWSNAQARAAAMEGTSSTPWTWLLGRGCHWKPSSPTPWAWPTMGASARRRGPSSTPPGRACTAPTMPRWYSYCSWAQWEWGSAPQPTGSHPMARAPWSASTRLLMTTLWWWSATPPRPTSSRTPGAPPGGRTASASSPATQAGTVGCSTKSTSSSTPAGTTLCHCLGLLSGWHFWYDYLHLKFKLILYRFCSFQAA